MAFDTVAYSVFGTSFTIGGVNNLRFLTEYHPSPTDTTAKYSSNQADKVYTLDLSTYFPSNFTFDSTLFKFEVIIGANPLTTVALSNAVANGTTYPFGDYSARRPPSYSITGTTLTITKSTYDLFEGTDVVARAAAFCSTANGLPGVSCTSSNLPSNRFEYEDAIFHIFLVGV